MTKNTYESLKNTEPLIKNKTRFPKNKTAFVENGSHVPKNIHLDGNYESLFNNCV